MCSPLYYAIKNNQPYAVCLLLENGAIPATELFDIRYPRMILTSDSDSDSDSNYHYYYSDSDSEDKDNNPYYDILLEYGGKWDILTDIDYRSSSYEDISKLIERGASVNIHGYEERTPLHHIMDDKNIDSKYPERNKRRNDIIKLFLNHGADINAQNKVGATPLHMTTKSDLSQAAITLIENDANINATDHNGRTSLHYAAYNNSVDTAEILIKHGADIMIEDKKGNLPIHTALSYSRCVASMLVHVMIQRLKK